RASARGGNDLLSLLIASIDPESGQAMDDADVRDNLLTFVTAGHETTALALTWTFYLLSLHPEIEARVAAEIEAGTARAPLAPRPCPAGAALAPQHLDALAFTRQVLMESMRLYPPAPLIARTLLRDLALRGERITRETQIYVPVYAVHRHQALWHAPDLFDPD